MNENSTFFSHCGEVCQTSLFLRFSVLSMQFPLKSWRTAKSTTKIMLSGVPFFAFLFLRSMALKCSAEYGPIKRWLRHILVNSQFGYVCSTVNEKWAKNTGVSKRRRHYSYYTMPRKFPFWKREREAKMASLVPKNKQLLLCITFFTVIISWYQVWCDLTASNV